MLCWTISILDRCFPARTSRPCSLTKPARYSRENHCWQPQNTFLWYFILILLYMIYQLKQYIQTVLFKILSYISLFPVSDKNAMVNALFYKRRQFLLSDKHFILINYSKLNFNTARDFPAKTKRLKSC